MVVTACLLSTTWLQSAWPLPLTRVSDIEYSTAGRRSSGRLQEMVTDVAFSNDVVISRPVEIICSPMTVNHYCGNILPHLSQSLQLPLPVHW